MAPRKRHQKVRPDDLTSSALFADLDSAELETAAALGEMVDLERGAILTDQGRMALDCYLLMDGTASVFFGNEFVTTVGPGTTVGEMAQMAYRPRSATVIADSAISAVHFAAEDFRRLLDELPTVRSRIAALAEQRAALLRDVRN